MNQCFDGGTSLCTNCEAQGVCFADPEMRRLREHHEIVDQKLKEQGTPGRFQQSEQRARRHEFNWRP